MFESASPIYRSPVRRHQVVTPVRAVSEAASSGSLPCSRPLRFQLAPAFPARFLITRQPAKTHRLPSGQAETHYFFFRYFLGTMPASTSASKHCLLRLPRLPASVMQLRRADEPSL